MSTDHTGKPNSILGAKGGPASESGLLEYEQLTNAQQRALVGVDELLQTLATNASHQERHDALGFLPRIRPETFNSAVLIDGARGSGKTVVLLHLLDYWNRNVRILTKQNPDAETATHRHIESNTQARSRAGHPHVLVPIGLIELQPLPNSSLILPYVATLFRRVVANIEEGRFALHSPDDTIIPKRDRIRRFREVQPKSRERWARFMASAASWTNTFVKRAQSLDTESYILELEEQGLNALDIRPSFEAFIDALVDDFQREYGTRHQPLFVVAIDDADMNAEKTVELLHTIRTLRHPRVAYVLTGDSELFVEMLRDHQLAGLRAPLRYYDIGQSERVDLAKSVRASQLAQDVFDKCIPEKHRFTLPPLSPERRLKAVQEIVGELSFDGRRLLEYFELRPTSDKNTVVWNTTTIFALPSRVRGLRDLRDFLEHQRAHLTELVTSERAKGSDSPTEPALPDLDVDVAYALSAAVVRKLWTDRIGDSDIERSLHDALASRIRIKDETRGTLVIENDAFRSVALYRQHTKPVPVSIARVEGPRPKSSRRKAGADEAQRVAKTESTQGLVRANDIYAYEIYYRPPGRTKEILLPQPVESAFILATDIAADSRFAEFIGQSKSPGAAESFFVTVEYGTSNNLLIDFFWPLPDWDSFRDVDHFGYRWKQRCADAASIEELAGRYLQLVLEISRRTVPSIEAANSSQLSDVVADLKALKEQFDKKEPDTTAERDLRRWLTDGLKLLTYVESGLQKSARRMIHDAITDNVPFTGGIERASDAVWRGAAPNALVRRGKERGAPVTEVIWQEDAEGKFTFDVAPQREPGVSWRRGFAWAYRDIFAIPHS